MDAIDAAAAVMRRYCMSQVRYGARELASLTWQSAMQVNAVEALSRLFEEEKDAITIIKWKEVLDLLEEATDRCEDCANVLESIIVKHG